MYRQNKKIMRKTFKDFVTLLSKHFTVYQVVSNDFTTPTNYVPSAELADKLVNSYSNIARNIREEWLESIGVGSIERVEDGGDEERDTCVMYFKLHNIYMKMQYPKPHQVNEEANWEYLVEEVIPELNIDISYVSPPAYYLGTEDVHTGSKWYDNNGQEVTVLCVTNTKTSFGSPTVVYMNSNDEILSKELIHWHEDFKNK